MKEHNPLSLDALILEEMCRKNMAPEMQNPEAIEKLSQETTDILVMIKASGNIGRCYFLTATIFRYIHADLVEAIMKKGE